MKIGAIRVNAIDSQFVVPIVDKALRCSDSFEDCVRRSYRIVATNNEDTSFSIGVLNS